MKALKVWFAAAAAGALAMGGVAHVGGSAHADGPDASTAGTDVSIQIVGGGITNEQWPFMVNLGGCGGSLVAPTWVVTAAHCVDGGAPARVRIDSNNQAQGGELISTKRAIQHPSWRNNDGADLALIELASPAKAAPIPIANAAGPIGTPTKLLGWGATNANGGGGSTMLKELDTSIVASKRCEMIGGFMEGKEICTDNPGGNQGACFGDSGGPQIKKVNGRWELIGATSRGEDICARNASVYTSVPAYMDWLREASKNAIPTPGTGGTPDPTPSPQPTSTPTPSPTATPTESPTEPAPGTGEFVNEVVMDIKDYSVVRSEINSTFPNAKSVELKIRIEHQCAENLELAMVTPNGRRTVFKRASYPNRCTPWSGEQVQTFKVSTQSEGRWVLEVTDRYRGNTGRLLGWGMKFS